MSAHSSLDGEIITECEEIEKNELNEADQNNLDSDILKICVVNRYTDAPVSIAYIRNFNLKEGAMASSVAHDSHNIVAVGVDDDSICKAVNLIIEEKGGLAAVGKGEEHILPLPIAGLMSAGSGVQIAENYLSIDQFVKSLGCTLRAPFMTLSFMALLVIPKLKISDKGLFDVERFGFVR